MPMKPVFYIFLLCVVSCVPRGAKQADPVHTGRVISVSDSLLRAGRADTIDLGHLMQGEVIVRELMIRNDGTRPFVIVGIETSCGCTTVEYHRQPVKPAETVPFTFRFDTNGFRGWQFKTIKIRTSLNNRAQLLVVTADIE